MGNYNVFLKRTRLLTVNERKGSTLRDGSMRGHFFSFSGTRSPSSFRFLRDGIRRFGWSSDRAAR